MAEDTMVKLVRNVINTKYEDLREEDINFAKKALLDCLGIMVAGTSVEDCDLVLEQVKEWGGIEEATMMVYGGKVPLPNAALINNMLARALDLDDVLEEGFHHSAAHVMPPVMVAAEKRGDVTGKEYILAFTLGTDLNCRIATSNATPCTVSGRFNIHRIWGAIAGIGKIFGFDENIMMNAMGIGYGMAHGELQGHRDGAFSCLLESGFNAKNSMMACQLAKRGITGTRNILDGHYGFYNAFEPNPDREKLLKDLGKVFWGSQASIKLYPSSRATHPGIDAALELVTKNDIKPEDVESVKVGMFDFCYNIVGAPIEEKRNPKNMAEAQFSMPFCVAVAIAKRSVFLDEMKDEMVNDPQIRELMQKIDTSIDSKLQKFQANVTIKTKDGKSYFKEVLRCIGHPENPISYEDVVDKFRKCAEYSKKEISQKNLEDVISMVNDLENIKDVSSLVRLLTP